MTISRWNPMHDLAAVEVDRLNRMFNTVFGGEPLASGAWSPAVDISEAPNHDLVVKAEIPAMKKEDIKVSVDGNVVSISAEVKQEKEESVGKRVVRSERYYGAVSRSFTVSTPSWYPAETRVASSVAGSVKLRRKAPKPRSSRWY